MKSTKDSESLGWHVGDTQNTLQHTPHCCPTAPCYYTQKHPATRNHLLQHRKHTATRNKTLQHAISIYVINRYVKSGKDSFVGWHVGGRGARITSFQFPVEQYDVKFTSHHSFQNPLFPRNPHASFIRKDVLDGGRSQEDFVNEFERVVPPPANLESIDTGLLGKHSTQKAVKYKGFSDKMDLKTFNGSL